MKPRDLSPEESSALLSAGRFGRLGLCDQSGPYVIPISYVFADGRIYLHSRSGGKKLKMVELNPKVCFEVDVLEEGRWRSVIVGGRATVSTSTDAKRRMFDAFSSKAMGGHGGKSFRREDMERMEMAVWEIEILEISGREGVW